MSSSSLVQAPQNEASFVLHGILTSEESFYLCSQNRFSKQWAIHLPPAWTVRASSCHWGGHKTKPSLTTDLSELHVQDRLFVGLGGITIVASIFIMVNVQPVTPTQLIRTGFGQYVSCAMDEQHNFLKSSCYSRSPTVQDAFWPILWLCVISRSAFWQGVVQNTKIQ